MQVAFEDDDRITSTNLQIDFLAINVTISPFWAIWQGLVYSNGSAVEQNGMNFTRASALNISVQWNASDYSVIDSVVILNNSNSGVEEEYNISLAPGWPGFGGNGNYTNYTLNLSNTSLFRVGGNWTVKMRAWDSFYQQNTTTNFSYFGLWAWAKVTRMDTNESGNRTLGGKQVKLYCRVLDNESDYQVSGVNVSFYNSSGYVDSGTTNSTGWASIDYIESNTTAGNYTIICNITDQPEILYNASGDKSRNLTLEIGSDSVPPLINSFRFEYTGLATNKTNLYANFTIVANITDNPTNATSMERVKVNITYPDGNVREENMWQNSSSPDIWVFRFNTSNQGVPVNATGVYGVNLTAWDLGDNLAYLDWLTNGTISNFTAYSHLNVTLEYYVNENVSSYNRGEPLILYARDVNGIPLTGLNWTVNITKYNGTGQNLSYGNGTANYTILANSSDPTGNWSIEVVNVAGPVSGGNSGNGTIGFNVSNTLSPYFLSPLYQDRAYNPSQNVNSATLIYTRVNYSRGATTNYTMSVNLTADVQGGNSTHMLERESGGNRYYNSTMTITAPGSNSVNFWLYALAGDDYNNTGIGSIRLVTVSAGDSGSGQVIGSSSGTRIINASANVSCNCTTWENIGCGIGECVRTHMYQERTCTPSGCDNESRCLYHPDCLLKRDFNMTLEGVYNGTVKVLSGKEERVTITLGNTGEANLTLNLTLERECCSLSFLERVVNLSVGAELGNIFLDIHANLTHMPGAYTINATARWDWLEKSMSFRVIVERNPLLSELERLREGLAVLEARIGEYGESWVYVGSIEKQAGEISQALEEAERGIAEDRLDVLEERVGFASSGLEDAMGRLSSLWLEKAVLDNKWWIVLGFVLAVIASYFVIEVLVPFQRLTREIKGLSREEKEKVQKRREIQKQYFMGKINEQAFNEMLIGEQERILGTRGKIIEKLRERKRLLKERLSPGAVYRWVKSGPLKLVKGVKKAAKRK